jgi:UDP-N-acetylmuramoylalanine--D-glutamate ligase
MSDYSIFIKKNLNKKVLIFGLGLQGGGVSSAKYFSKITKNIRITDLKNEDQLKPSLDIIEDIPFGKTFGTHKFEDIDWADIVVFNQDIFNKDPNSPYLAYAQQKNKQIETEIGLFFQLAQCPIIGITGTRGKTTTTIAINNLLKKAGFKTFLGGNIPESQNLAQVEQAHFCDYAVLELSNFQLHGLNLKKLSPHISVVTSISPDHLISYKRIEDYISDKVTICKYQTENDYLVIKQNVPFYDSFVNQTKAKIINFSSSTLPVDWDLNLKGIHNRENLSAVYKVGQILKINPQILKSAITSFSGVPFRLETIANINGVEYVNDTTASTPSAALIALKSFPKNKIIWIAGGNTKNLPQEELVETASKVVKKYVLLKGNATQNLIKQLKEKDNNWNDKYLGLFDDLAKAVNTAFQSAQKDDIVLLSPGFTSFAMFNNEFDRGRQFNEIVSKLK